MQEYEEILNRLNNIENKVDSLDEKINVLTGIASTPRAKRKTLAEQKRIEEIRNNPESAGNFHGLTDSKLCEFLKDPHTAKEVYEWCISNDLQYSYTAIRYRLKQLVAKGRVDVDNKVYKSK